jgi:indolepyruvate ferredoxin oxidoreductase beta subunit
MKKVDEFNIVVFGVGGQGVLSVADVITKAALAEGYDVRACELHGLSQRGGSLQCHIRFGKNIYSPLVRQGYADLIIALDPLEALRACFFASKDKGSIILSNANQYPPLSYYVTKAKKFSLEEIKQKVKGFSREQHFVPATAEVRKLINDVYAINFYLLGYALAHDLIPLKKAGVWKQIKNKIHARFIPANKKVFEAASKK